MLQFHVQKEREREETKAWKKEEKHSAATSAAFPLPLGHLWIIFHN
jgi:post-segregation antitoxin (ccd killing protein)